MIELAHRHEERRDGRRVHHSPLFWVGVAMFLTAFLTAILIYVHSRIYRYALTSMLRAEAPGRIHRQVL